jgi:hypothetical protein
VAARADTTEDLEPAAVFGSAAVTETTLGEAEGPAF